MISVSYLMKRKIEKMFLDEIYNTKILYIILFNDFSNDQDFAKLQKEIKQREMDNVEYGNFSDSKFNIF